MGRRGVGREEAVGDEVLPSDRMWGKEMGINFTSSHPEESLLK